jgi:hypothetical protein
LGRNHEIRIHDGDHVVQSEGFIPRISYHLKTVLTTETNGLPAKQIVGSGNLSASGLGAGIEAGCLVDHSTIDPSCSKALILELEKIWESSIPFGRLIDAYEAGYKLLTQPNVKSPKRKASAARETFWIDVGYVTKNRGEDRPGNQFDLPRGSHEFLGIAKVINPRLNSVLGEVNIGTPRGQIVARSLRFGNNAMEKLTLPIPEEHGYECYDGKILTFNVRQNGTLDLLALEYDDFFRIYGQNITSSKEMQSGRRYGTVALGT